MSKQNLSCDKVKVYKAWFSSSLELEAIGSIFKEIGLALDYRADCENVYEWIVCQMPGLDTELNVSRKHCDGEGFENEPIHVLLMYGKDEPSNSEVEVIAKSIAKAIKTDVHTGFIDYVSGDDFEYRSMSVRSS